MPCAARQPDHVWGIYHVFAGMALLDAFLTYFALRFVPGAQELNPVVQGQFIEPLGVEGVWLGKILLVAVVGVITAVVLRRAERLQANAAGDHREIVAMGLVWVALLQAAVAASNLLVMAKVA